MKKTIIITSIILGVLALGVGVYFAWQKSRQQTIPAAPTPFVNTGGIQVPAPTVGATNKLVVVSKNTAIDYWVMNATSTNATSTNSIFI